MRKIVFMLMLLACSVVVFAQRTITGTVRDEKGNPVPFATVSEVGKTNSTTADANGVFTLKVAENARLQVTATGHQPQTVTVTGNSVNVTLTVVDAQMQEVVVTTAFGVKRSQRITPYSAQTVDREQLAIIPQTNVNSALAGKVAGAQFRGQSPIKLNDQGAFRLRGGLAIGGDVGALYVVDGTPVNSFDLNPDDIESVTVLKGANATALLGERASGGAVMITTRKRGDRNTAGIEVNQGITFDKVYILPKYQNLYAGGSAPELRQFTWAPGMPQEWQPLSGSYYHDMTDDASWGPRMVGQQYLPWYAWVPGSADFGKSVPLVGQPDNMRDFWSTGVTNVTNVSFSKTGQGFNTRVSYTNNGIKGMLPNTRANKHTLFTTASLDLSSRLTLAANVNFVNYKIIGTFDDGYANQSAGGFNQWFHRNLDINKLREHSRLRTPIGTYASWNAAANPGSSTDLYKGNYWYNFYTYYEQLDYKQTRDRLFGDVSLTYNINKNFKLRGTVRKNALNTTYENIVPSELEQSASQTGQLATYSTGVTRSNEMNYEGLATYTSMFLNNKLNVNMNVGGNVLQTRYNDTRANTVQGLNVPGLYTISNSKANPTITNAREGTEVRSVFGFGDIEWNRMIAVNFALRNDWYSTLPTGNNSLLSPSVGASFFFSDLTKNALPWLSFGKLFASWGKKPLSLNVYQNNFAYNIGQNQWNGNYLTTVPNAGITPGVTGALITTYEAGFDFRFAKNRFGLNFTYYDETSKNPPISVSTSAYSGFTSVLMNATEVQRKGIEIVADARVMTRRDFEWTVNKTFGYLIKNPIVELLPGQNRILLAGGAFGTRFARAFHELGQDWGQLIGGGIARNEDGLPLLDASGMYVRDADKHYGSVVPKMTGGLVNTFYYKGFTFNFNIDYQFGGKFFSLSEMWGHYSGLLESTAATNDKGMNVRDAVSDGGGVHVVGVAAADGKTPVDMYVDAQTYYHQFYSSQIAEPFVHGLSFVKLREVSLGYRVPVAKLGRVGNVLKGATISLVARNPLLLYRETESFDPSEISGLQGEDGNMPGTRSLGINFKFNF